jgi:hypothetical protein
MMSMEKMGGQTDRQTQRARSPERVDLRRTHDAAGWHAEGDVAHELAVAKGLADAARLDDYIAKAGPYRDADAVQRVAPAVLRRLQHSGK